MIYLLEGNVPLNECYDDDIEQIANSTYQLTFKFPTSDAKWKALKEEVKLVADDLHDEQEFTIFEIVKQHGYVTVYANQAMSALNHYSISQINVDRVAGNVVMSALAGSFVRQSPFSFYSDIMDKHTLNVSNRSALDALVKGKHSILGQWGGDLVRDKYAIKLLKNGGVENESLFMYKKNMRSYQQTTSTKELRTRIHFRKKIEVDEGESKKEQWLRVTVDSPLINKYQNIYEADMEVQDEDVKDLASLTEYGKQYYRTTLCDLIEDSLELDVVGTGDVPVKMFDVVTVYHERFDMDMRKKITKYHYSPMGKRLKSVGFGTSQQTLGGALGSMVSDAVKSETAGLVDDFDARLGKELINANRVFDQQKTALEREITDGIEQAKAEAERKAQEVRDGIHSEFQDFETEWYKSNEEREKRVQSALTIAGASRDLAKTAKEISDQNKTALDKLKTSAEEARRSLGEDIKQLTGSISAQAQDLTKTKDRLSQTETDLRQAKATADQAKAGLDGKVSTADFVQSQKEWSAKFSSVQVGGRNLLPNSDFKKTGAVTSFTVAGKTYNTGLVGWATYNGGIPNPETSYHAYVGEYGGRKQVGIYNESNGLRNWKAFSLDLKNDFPQTTNEFIFSADVYASGPGTKLFGGFYYYDKSGNRNFHAGQFRKDITAVEKWHRVSVAVPFNLEKCDFSKGIRLYIYGFGFTSNSILAIDKIKLETGTIATDWSPAPEDTDGLITAVQSEFKLRADGLDSQVKSLQEKDKATDITVTRLTQGLGEVTLGVERLTRNLETGLADKVTSAQLKVELDGIRTKVAETDAKTAKIAEVETTVNGVKESLSRISVGGRNYIRNYDFKNWSSFRSTNSEWTFERLTDSQAKSGYQIKATCRKAGGGGFWNSFFDLRGAEWQGKTLTWGLDVKASRPVNFFDFGFEAGGLKKNTAISTEWQRITHSFMVRFTKFFNFVLYAHDWKVGDVVYIRDPKLEDGTIATAPTPALEDGEAEITAAKAEFTRTAEGLTQKLTAVESYVAKDEERSEALKSYVRKETASKIEAERSAIAKDYVAKSNLTETVNNINRRFEQVANQTDTKIAEYGKGVEGRFATITSQLNGKVSQTDFQKVQETSKLYERIIGSTEKDVTDKIARMVMTNQLFQVEVGKSSALRTVQRQLDNSWAIQNLTSAGQVVSHINLLGKNAGIKAETIRLEGTTLADKLSAYEGRFNKLFVADGTFSKLKSDVIGANSITADSLRMDIAFADKIVSNQAVLNRLFAKEVISTFVKAVEVDASQIRSEMLKALSGAMTIDLDNATTIYNKRATVKFNSQSNAFYRERKHWDKKDGHNTIGALMFKNSRHGGVMSILGNTSHQTIDTMRNNLDNGGSNGDFAGIRIVRDDRKTPYDRIEMIADRLIIGHSTNFNDPKNSGFYFLPTAVNGWWNLGKILQQISDKFREHNWGAIGNIYNMSHPNDVHPSQYT